MKVRSLFLSARPRYQKTFLSNKAVSKETASFSLLDVFAFR